MESDSARMCEASIEKTGVSIPLVMNLEKMYDSRCMEQIKPHILKFNSNMFDVMAVAFRLYDIWQRGFIERDEVREMILALLRESDLVLSHDIIELIIDKVFSFFLHISLMINYSF